MKCLMNNNLLILDIVLFVGCLLICLPFCLAVVMVARRVEGAPSSALSFSKSVDGRTQLVLSRMNQLLFLE